MIASAASQILVVGAGVYGVTATLALLARGHRVTLLDQGLGQGFGQGSGPGPLPHPLAASTDISKVVRLDYGADADYVGWMEAALDGWQRWNRDWPRPLFHQTGVLALARAPFAPGGFEYESYKLLTARGHRLQRLSSADITARFPAWRTGYFVDGYYNPEGGYAESGEVVKQLLVQAERAGAHLLAETRVAQLVEEGGKVVGVRSASGAVLRADRVVLTAGAWTPQLLPESADFLCAVGQPVFHLQPRDPSLFTADRFPTFFADIARTGYYGFPLHGSGVIKIANHGTGVPMHPESPLRQVTEAQIADLRAFLADALPKLASAPIVATRVCLYADTRDGHLWIARHPQRPGLVLCTGDSGHAFKFAPVLGDLIADAVEDRPAPLLAKFRHRPEVRPLRAEEAARRHAS